jgi:hypothetical protein
VEECSLGSANQTKSRDMWQVVCGGGRLGLDEYDIDGPPGRPGSGRVNFIALTAVLRCEFHHTPFHAKDA